MGEIALESLSNLALILRKSDPTLDSPGLVAAFCGGGGDGGGGGAGAGAGRGLLVDMVEAFGEGEEKVLSGICQVFEVCCVCHDVSRSPGPLGRCLAKRFCRLVLCWLVIAVIFFWFVILGYILRWIHSCLCVRVYVASSP